MPACALPIPATPTTYTFELTSRCNSACVGCGNVFSRTLGEMPLARWTDLLEGLRPHIATIRLTGGEPTLHPEFAGLVRLVDGLGVPFVIFSNGLWPDRAATLKLLQNCAHLDGLLISLHGREAAAHEAFAGVDSFDRVVATLRAAVEAGLAVNTNTVLTLANHQDLPRIAEFSQRLGAQFTGFSRYYGPPLPVTELSEGELQAAIASIQSLADQGLNVQLNNCVPVCFHRQPTKSCPAGITHCTVDPLGRVRPCTHAPVVLGDLFDTPIDAIWQGEAAQAWRALIPVACHSCAEVARCRGACKALAHHLRRDQDPLIREPLREPLAGGGPARRMQLYAGARPRANFMLRRESFGYLLVNRNQIIPVRAEARPLLDMLDGATTLRELQERFGKPGLVLVAYLFNKGLVILQQ